ncbi:cellobiohydrolase II [Amylostereum chailletii]|nr:cellobiohydrolase II [Amylostereum chailletii]
MPLAFAALAAGFTMRDTAATENPYTGHEIFLSPPYASKVQAAADISNATLAASALKVASIPTFIWFDSVASVPTLGEYLGNALALAASSGQKSLVQIVVYNLPDRDCSANSSNGELSIADGGAEKYRGFIDGLVEQIVQFPDVRVVAIIEPDSLANLVTNLKVEKCANAQSIYLSSVTYALKQLAAVGVYMYMDAGHAGWLGWPSNLDPAATLFAQVYSDAGKSPFIRGLSTNVANYNALSAASPDPIADGNPNYDELHYINALAPKLADAGFSAQFIVDQGRSGVQNIRQSWSHFCNVKGAGFGTRPTTNTNSSLIDAIVWAKPGGECDGTSNSSAPRYDSRCSLDDALQPAPEAGTWFQAYFEQLVSNANPPL